MTLSAWLLLVAGAAHAHRMVLPKGEYESSEETPWLDLEPEAAPSPVPDIEPEPEGRNESGTHDGETPRNDEAEKITDPPATTEEPGVSLEEVTVVGERALSAASDQTVRNKDFMNYPRRSASDLLRFVPGLHITQHTGGAKAHQIFLRGFDAEHGQDVAAYLDGIPLNETSHVHGIGYLDLHFIIPESIRKIWVMKGPYDPRFGNFATAGVINFVPYKSRPYQVGLAAGGGSDAYVEGLGEYYRDWLSMDTYLVAEYDRTDGYTEPGEMWAARGFLQHRFRLGELGELRLLYAGYGARSEAADILPLSWIEEGKVSGFTALDDSNRVDVDRHLAGVTFDWQSGSLNGRLQGYYNYKRTEIFSNYSFYYFHPETGDQIEQSDERHYAGLNATLRWLTKTGAMEFSTEGGINLRSDWVDQTQATTVRRERVNVLNHYEFNETAVGIYLDERMQLAPWVRVILGMRADVLLYNGDGIQDRYGEFNIITNKTPFYSDDPAVLDTRAYALSPKASVVFRPFRPWTIFLNFGRGFSSTYARKMAWEKDQTLPVVTAAELGTRLKLWHDRLTVAATGWWADKDAESVFDSEVGTTIPMGKSRRFGAEAEIRISPIDWLYLGTDVYYIHARFVDGDKPIPNMAEWQMTNVVSLMHPKGFKGTIRGRFLGPRNHDLGYESDAYYIVDLQLGYEIDPVEVTLSVENLFNATWYDSVYAYPSRPEKGGEVVEGLHVTPGTPTTARLRISARF